MPWIPGEIPQSIKTLAPQVGYLIRPLRQNEIEIGYLNNEANYR